MNLNILIIENEVYLAQSISARLVELGHTCTIQLSLEENIKNEEFDIVLLSTNINGQDFGSTIKRYKDSIVILMVSYVSNHTVTLPLDLGAKDYIIKPFMIDDLINKINHFVDYKQQQQKVDVYEKYLSTVMQQRSLVNEDENLQFPIFVFANLQQDTDSFAYQYSFEYDKILDFFVISNENIPSDFDHYGDNLVYIKGFDTLTKANRTKFLKLIKNKNFIIDNNKNIDVNDFATIELDLRKSLLYENEILSIEEYIKYIISNYQDKFTDTKISEYLGLSRKSIWEKRKKYGIKK